MAFWDRVLRTVAKSEQPAAAQDLDDHGQPRNRLYNKARLVDRAVDELIGMSKMILADGQIDAQEANFLLRWMEQNRAVASAWPGDVLYRRLSAMLVDHTLDADEQRELLTLLQQMTSAGQAPGEYVANLSTALPITRPLPTLVFPQRAYCLTGQFLWGTRRDCEQAIVTRGGQLTASLTGATHYLVIGLLGSTDWIHSTHGRKIEKAIDMRSKGHPIAIVSEGHWTEHLERTWPLKS